MPKGKDTGVQIDDVDFVKNLYYVENGKVIQFNKKSHKKEVIENVNTIPGKLYFIAKRNLKGSKGFKGVVREANMKNFKLRRGSNRK